jgi:hypothetical protein
MRQPLMVLPSIKLNAIIIQTVPVFETNSIDDPFKILGTTIPIGPRMV